VALQRLGHGRLHAQTPIDSSNGAKTWRGIPRSRRTLRPLVNGFVALVPGFALCCGGRIKLT
jgi:hypothetical protein